MTGPIDYEASERSMQILSTILLEVPVRKMLRGPAEKTLYDLLVNEDTALIQEGINFDSHNPYSPDITDIVYKWAGFGVISQWRPSGCEFGLMSVDTLELFSQGADFDKHEREYLRDLGQRLLKEYRV